ncbi:hypothetical protein [Streptomyces pathocidini]|uniref:hypothetical protein n=1 Tax=Streptomyces pathocidini TaxID=1650571 RepID=UPI0006E1391E|nr:hypothetical protein [Streptomyces pathocidini]
MLAAFAREAVDALLARGRVADARGVLAELPERVRARGRFRLLEAQVSLAAGDAAGARALLDLGIEVADLREGDEVLSDLWSAVAARLAPESGAADPLPDHYDFRMRPVRD